MDYHNNYCDENMMENKKIESYRKTQTMDQFQYKILFLYNAIFTLKKLKKTNVLSLISIVICSSRWSNIIRSFAFLWRVLTINE